MRTSPTVSSVAETRSTEFVALGHAGSEAYAGLETFANPGVSHVELTSDELTAVCPVTSQPDLYVATIEYWPQALCLESKSLKLYLNGFRDERACEVAGICIWPAELAELALSPVDDPCHYLGSLAIEASLALVELGAEG